MWPFTKNSPVESKKTVNEDKKMKRKIIYIVEAVIDYNDEGDWKRKVRVVRKKIKEVISSDPAMRITKIQNKTKEV